MKSLIKSRNLLFFIVLVLLLTFFYLFYFSAKKTRSEIVYFYPQNCLGSFVNPEKAQGEPEANNSEEINESNSTVYLGGFKEIYCGNFQGPIKDGEINKITLNFNFLLTDERKEVLIIESTSTKSLIEKILPAKEIEIINTSTQLDISTSSLNFFKFVYAQRLAQADQNLNWTSAHNTQSDVNTNNNQTDKLSTEGEFSKDNTQIGTTDNGEISTSLKTSGTLSISSLFDIFYTLDGQKWDYLGSITDQNWQNITFEIPVNDWLLISKIQIKIQSNPLAESIPYLYLESMVLEIEYNSNLNNKETKLVNNYECLELENKLLSIKKLDNDNNNLLICNSCSNSEELRSEKPIDEIELIFSKSLNEFINIYQLKVNKNYEFWLEDKDKNSCKKLEDINLQDRILGIYNDTLYYLNNNVLMGYEIFSGNNFSLTFENDKTEIPLDFNRTIKIKKLNNNLIFEEINLNKE